MKFNKAMVTYFIQELIGEIDFGGEEIKISKEYTYYGDHSVGEPGIGVEYCRESLDALHKIFKNNEIVSSLAVTGEEKGGIDLTALPVAIQSPLNQPLTANMPIAGSALNFNLNLDKELQDIQDMLNAGIMPSSERIKEYALASSSLKSEDYSREIDKILGCIADIFRLEEEKAKPTPQTLKDALIPVGIGDKPTRELQLALNRN